MEDILDIFKYILPSVVTFLAAYFIIKAFLDREYKNKLMDLRMQNHSTITPIRLQAYERMTLFLERIALTQLITRVHKSGMSARLLQNEMVKTIRAEYEHNLSQQIYVTQQCWNSIKTAKEETIRAINIASTKVPDDAAGLDLINVIFELVTKVEKLPTDIALEQLKLEAKQTF
ncbi:MAG TPA: hypothetical protein PK323_03540 [Bacteroidia bacterium]|nr:hypothetical protein [Bacteroidia bacterium]